MAKSPATSLLGAIIEARITALGGLGDGISSYNEKPLFVAKSCVGDKLRLRIIHENHEGLTAAMEAILEPGPERRLPPCPYFSACGGCTLQQLEESSYHAFKTSLLHNALSRAGFAAHEARMLFLPAATRRRVEFKTHFPNGQLQLAFYEPRSRNPVAIENCLVLEPALQALMLPLQTALRRLTFQQYIRAINLTLADSGIDLLLQVSALTPKPDRELAPLLEEVQLARASLKVNDGPAIPAAERFPVTMHFGNTDVPLPPEAFLQASAAGQHALTEAVLAHIPAQGRVVDLFCGLGTYTFPLLFRQSVHAVELDAAMVAALTKTQYPGLSAATRDLFKDPLRPDELSAFSAAVMNPPRAGAKAQVQAIASSALRHVVMVSCNPSSFTRDAQLLKQAGFSLTFAKGIDQFVYNPHLEIVAAFTR